MPISRSTFATAALAVVVIASLAAVSAAVNPTLLPGGDDYETTTVTVASHCETLAEVDVRVADSYEKRYTGLSDTESLGEDEGMLFVHDDEGEHAYVMRDMAFPLDIVFVAENGTITEIHHAELPPEDADDLTRYTGTGKYVLEVPYGYTNETDIETGDTVRVDDY